MLGAPFARRTWSVSKKRKKKRKICLQSESEKIALVEERTEETDNCVWCRIKTLWVLILYLCNLWLRRRNSSLSKTCVSFRILFCSQSFHLYYLQNCTMDRDDYFLHCRCLLTEYSLHLQWDFLWIRFVDERRRLCWKMKLENFL